MNHDIIFNIALYLSGKDLKQFLIVNRELIDDEYFWKAKFIIDNILVINSYSAKEYFKICQCKQNAKFIVMVNKIEYAVGGITNNKEFVTLVNEFEQIIGQKLSWKGYHDGVINIEVDKNNKVINLFTDRTNIEDIMISIIEPGKYYIYYLEKDEEIKTETEIETILTLALYAGWNISDDHGVPFITCDDKDGWSDRQILTFEDRTKIFKYYNS